MKPFTVFYVHDSRPLVAYVQAFTGSGAVECTLGGLGGSTATVVAVLPGHVATLRTDYTRGTDAPSR